MRRSVSVFASTTLLTSACLLAACAGRVRGPSGVALSPSALDSLAAQVTTLEIERIALVAGETPSVSLREIDARIAALDAHVRSLANADSVERAVEKRLLVALDARQSILDERIRQARFAYTEALPAIRIAREELRLIDKRRAAIRLENREFRDGSSERRTRPRH